MCVCLCMCACASTSHMHTWASYRKTPLSSLTWPDLEPNSPATTSSSASRSVAARTFCRSCCCSSLVENASSSSSMPASFVITYMSNGRHRLFSPPNLHCTAPGHLFPPTPQSNQSFTTGSRQRLGHSRWAQQKETQPSIFPSCTRREGKHGKDTQGHSTPRHGILGFHQEVLYSYKMSRID